MKGRASKKFQSFHPDSHKLFKSLVQNAKVSVNQPEDLENVDEEVANMIKNKFLTQVRQEDFVWEYNRKCKKLLNSNKSITWSCDLKEEFNFEKFDGEEEVFHREEWKFNLCITWLFQAGLEIICAINFLPFIVEINY